MRYLILVIILIGNPPIIHISEHFSLTAGTLAYFIFTEKNPILSQVHTMSPLNYAFVPILILIICTYFIVSAFFNVFTMAVDTLFLCLLEDMERNDGTKYKPYFMSTGLKRVLNLMEKSTRPTKSEEHNNQKHDLYDSIPLEDYQPSAPPHDF